PVSAEHRETELLLPWALRLRRERCLPIVKGIELRFIRGVRTHKESGPLLEKRNQKDFLAVVKPFNPRPMSRSARPGLCDYENRDVELTSALCGSDLGGITPRRTIRVRVLVDKPVLAQIICVVAPGVEQSDRRSIGPQPARAGLVNPDPLRPAIHPQLTKHVRSDFVWPPLRA